MNDYNASLDRTASDIRDELTNRIREAVNSNQECFIAHWLLQNPDADLTNITLCHGFKGNSYTFWVEEKQSVHTQEQEAIVDVLVHSRGNQYVKDDAHYYNKRYLQLGTKDN